jgi:hypothetical protein
LVSLTPNMLGFHFNRNEKWTAEAWKDPYSMQIHPDPNIPKFGDKFGTAGNADGRSPGQAGVFG